MMGAPGRVHEGDIELGGAATGVMVSAPPAYGGPALSIGVTERVAIEGGADFGTGQWAMGWLGTRVTGRRSSRGSLTLVGDVELGAGGGAGGSQCDQGRYDRCDRINWYDRLAGGAYAGFGGALRWRIPAVYTRLRAQVTGAQGVPTTAWTSWSSGVELRFVDRVSLWTGVGLADYHNRDDHLWGGIYELGLAVRLR